MNDDAGTVLDIDTEEEEIMSVDTSMDIDLTVISGTEAKRRTRGI